MKLKSLLFPHVSIAAAMLGAMLLTSACESVDDDRIPYAEVRLTFHTVGEWNLYGVQGDAASSRTYIFNGTERVPSNFPYTTLDRTGYGGLLLVTDIMGDLHAYDLACPVEMRPNVRVAVSEEELVARCPSCGSTFDVFQNRGNPMTGPAHDRGYALKRYSVISGGATEYRVVTR